VGATFAGFLNIPDSGIFSSLPEGLTLRFEHFVEPTAAYFPEIDHPKFNLALAVISTLVAFSGIAVAYAYYWKGIGLHGLTERNKFARAGYRVLENKYYLDVLYTDIIVGGFKGPIAKGANWFNQNVIDGVVNLVGTSARKSGEFVYARIDQGVVDTLVDGSGAAAEVSGEVLRKAQTGKVQAYGAYLFLGAAVLALIFVLIAS
jgi:NADH-quinone oxidoreductase subunit L